MVIEGTSFDSVLHFLTVVVAVVLLIISAISYYRTKKAKFLYICSAFLLFALKEVLTAFYIFSLAPDTVLGITHLLNFVILILFFLGVVK